MGHNLPKGHRDPTKWTKKVCDWCGKEKELPISSANNGKIFFTCSRSCRGHMAGVLATKRWANYTKEEREAIIQKIGVRNSNGQGLVDWHKIKRPEQVAKVIEMMNAPTSYHPKGSRNAYRHSKPSTNPRLNREEYMPHGTCTLIAAHHEMLKNDPDRLTTDFMEEMCGVKCRCRVDKNNKLEVVEAEMNIDEVFERLSE